MIVKNSGRGRGYLPTIMPEASFFMAYIRPVNAIIGAAVGWFLGNYDGVFYALVAFVVVDYITGVLCAVIEKNLASAIGFRGIFQKIMIFLLVGIANVLDTKILGAGAMLRSAVIFFYIANEGISILENAGRMGLPIPEKMKTVFRQLQDK